MRKIIRRAAAVLLSAALLLMGTASAAAQIDPVEERLAAMSLRERWGSCSWCGSRHWTPVDSLIAQG